MVFLRLSAFLYLCEHLREIINYLLLEVMELIDTIVVIQKYLSTN